MGQQMQQMQQMLQNVNSALDKREVDIKEFEAKVKAFDAETKRISAAAAAMSPDQIQDIVLGTIHSMMSAGDLQTHMGELDTPPDTGGMV